MIEWRRCKIRLKVLKAISLMVLHAFLFSNIAFATSDIAPSDKLAPYLVTNDEDLEDVERASRQIGDIDGRTLADRYRDVRGAWARRHPIQWIRAHGETPKEGANGSYPLAGVEGALLRARYAQALRTSLEAGGITHNRVAQALNSTRRVLDTFEVNQITPALASARMSATGSLGCRELATPDITDDEAQVARDIAAEAMGRGDCTELDFTDSEYENIRDIISANAPARILPLIDDIRSGNVMLRAVDVYDEDTGMPLFGFPRKRPEDRTIVLFSDIGKDGKLYIYMTRALLVQCLPYFEVSDEERIRGRHAMAEILTYEYGATKLGMSRGELTHITFNFSSDYAKGTTESNLVVKGTGIPDLDRLMLENASRGVFNWESDFDYLTRIVSAQVWDPTKPRAQQFRVAVVEAIQNLLYLNCSEEKVRHDYMTSPTYEVSRAAYNVTHYMYPRRLPGIFGYDPAIPAQTVRSSIYRGQFLAGVADVDIPYEAALRIGRSIAITMMETFPGEKEEIYIAIGRDIRLSSPRIYRAIKEGLLRCGVNVVEIAETHSTVSMASEAMLHPELLGLDGIKRIHGAIAISGTRQPWVYNGIRIKYLSHERKGEGEIEVARDLKGDDLEGLIHRCRVVTMLTRARRGTGDDYAAVGFHENYRGKIKGLVCEKLDHEPGARPLEGMRVALDASHGVCGFYADILEDLGATAVRVNCRPNGYYPGHVPEPHDEAALDYLGVVVRDHSCDMGIIFSSDGGRVAVIDENGQEAPSDDLFKLLIDRETPPGEPSKVVVTPRVSESCRDFASTLTDREVAVVDCGKIGYAHVMDTILAEDAVFGGEDVGKFLLGPDYTDDAVRAASVILSLVKSDPVNRTLSQIVASYPRRVSLVWRIALRINESHARVRDLGGPDAFDNLLEDVLMDAVVANRDADGRPSAFHSGIVGVSTEDGLKIIFDDVTGRYRGWVFIRQSFTEPDRIYVDVEATNEYGVHEIIRRIYGILNIHFSSGEFLGAHSLEQLRSRHVSRLLLRRGHVSQKAFGASDLTPMEALQLDRLIDRCPRFALEHGILQQVKTVISERGPPHAEDILALLNGGRMRVISLDIPQDELIFFLPREKEEDLGLVSYRSPHPETGDLIICISRGLLENYLKLQRGDKQPSHINYFIAQLIVFHYMAYFHNASYEEANEAASTCASEYVRYLGTQGATDIERFYFDQAARYGKHGKPYLDRFDGTSRQSARGIPGRLKETFAIARELNEVVINEGEGVVDESLRDEEGRILVELEAGDIEALYDRLIAYDAELDPYGVYLKWVNDAISAVRASRSPDEFKAQFLEYIRSSNDENAMIARIRAWTTNIIMTADRVYNTRSARNEEAPYIALNVEMRRMLTDQPPGPYGRYESTRIAPADLLIPQSIFDRCFFAYVVQDSDIVDGGFNHTGITTVPGSTLYHPRVLIDISPDSFTLGPHCNPVPQEARAVLDNAMAQAKLSIKAAADRGFAEPYRGIAIDDIGRYEHFVKHIMDTYHIGALLTFIIDIRAILSVPRAGKKRCVIGALVGAGGVGKTTSAERLKEECERQGLKAAIVSTDGLLFGRFDRYHIMPDGEHTASIVDGPMYRMGLLRSLIERFTNGEVIDIPMRLEKMDVPEGATPELRAEIEAHNRLVREYDGEIAREVAHIGEDVQVLIVEGVFAADPQIRDLLNLIIGITTRTDEYRFGRKITYRDMIPGELQGGRKWSLEKNDYVRKQVTEQQYFMRPILERLAHQVWMVDENAIWIRDSTIIVRDGLRRSREAGDITDFAISLSLLANRHRDIFDTMVEHMREVIEQEGLSLDDFQDLVAQAIVAIDDEFTRNILTRGLIQLSSSELWGQAGHPLDRDMEFWTTAESTVNQKLASAAQSPLTDVSPEGPQPESDQSESGQSESGRRQSARGTPADRARAARQRRRQMAELATRPILTEVNPVRYAWAGPANRILMGLAEPQAGENDVAENWFNCTHPDHPSYISGTAVRVGTAELPQLTLEEQLGYHPEMLGPGMTEKEFFVKFLCTRFAPKVHMGFNERIEEPGMFDAFIEWLILERTLLEELKEALVEGLDQWKRKSTRQRKFEEFRKSYEAWCIHQADRRWADSGYIPDVARYVKPGFNLAEHIQRIRRNRQNIVSVLNEISLKEGMMLLSPVGYPHGIFGLSLQTHPLTGPDAKNEAWVVAAVRGPDRRKRLLLVEPQQTSNVTFSFADFFTPIVWKEGQPQMRKNLTGEIIERMVREGLKPVGTTPADFLLEPQPIREESWPDGSLKAKLESLVEGTYPVWDEEYFVSHKITLSGKGARRPAVIEMEPEETSHELLLIKGEVTVNIAGEEITLKLKEPGKPVTIFIPATIKGGYTIKAKGKAEVLKFFKRETPRKAGRAPRGSKRRSSRGAEAPKPLTPLDEASEVVRGTFDTVKDTIVTHGGIVTKPQEHPMKVYVHQQILKGMASAERRAFMFDKNVRVVPISSIADIPVVGDPRRVFVANRDVIVTTEDELSNIADGVLDVDSGLLANARILGVETIDKAHTLLREVIVAAIMLRNITEEDIRLKSQAYLNLLRILSLLQKERREITDKDVMSLIAQVPEDSESIRARARRLLRFIVRSIPLERQDLDRLKFQRAVLWAV